MSAILRPRNARRWASGKPSRSWPLKIASPVMWMLRSRIKRSRLSIDPLLPDPDSPTIPRTSPGDTEKLRSSTATSGPLWVAKVTRRWRTERRGQDAGDRGGWGSSIADSGVECRVDDVDHRVGEHNEERRVQNRCHDRC